ncbi:MAG TPA: hypothetical protein O0X50_02720, partial [Methanocorpusculum sp.]|nr:hypothetical protein [Methanocorpusculum sp.]
MADGSPQTIDRIQVEFSTNLEELIASLAVAETRLDAINDAFTRSETASQTWAASMESAGSAAAASSDGFTALSGNIDNLSGISEAGTVAVTTYADSLLGTQAAVTTANYQMEQAIGR